VRGSWGAVGGVAFAVGPLIGGVFTDAISWRWVWWSNVPVAIVALVLARPMLRGLAPGKKGVRFDVAGVGLLALGLFTAILALQQGSRWGWGSASILGLFAVAAVTLTAFVLVELRAKQPLVHLRLLANRVFTGGNVGTLVNSVALIGLLYFFNLYAQSSVLLDYSALLAGAALLPFGLGIFAASLVSGRLADRIGARIPVAVGLGLQAVGCYLLYHRRSDVQRPGPDARAGWGSACPRPRPPPPQQPPEECGEASGISTSSGMGVRSSWRSAPRLQQRHRRAEPSARRTA
jgi:MFS family permease